MHVVDCTYQQLRILNQTLTTMLNHKQDAQSEAIFILTKQN